MIYITMILGFAFWTLFVWSMAVGTTQMRIEVEEIERKAEIEMMLRMKKTDVVARRYMLSKQGGYVAFETNQN